MDGFTAPKLPEKLNAERFFAKPIPGIKEKVGCHEDASILDELHLLDFPCKRQSRFRANLKDKSIGDSGRPEAVRNWVTVTEVKISPSLRCGLFLFKACCRVSSCHKINIAGENIVSCLNPHDCAPCQL